MQYAWLAIIALSLVPVAFVAFFANPLVFLVLGPEVWHERVARLKPYRWWFVFAICVCGFATGVYAAAFG